MTSPPAGASTPLGGAVRGQYDSTNYEVSTRAQVPTLEEAEYLAQTWVADNGGEALIYRRRAWPWLTLVRVARVGGPG